MDKRTVLMEDRKNMEYEIKINHIVLWRCENKKLIKSNAETIYYKQTLLGNEYYAVIGASLKWKT